MLRIELTTIIGCIAFGSFIAVGILLFTYRIGGVERLDVVPKLILWGQTITICAMWPMLGWDSAETFSYSSLTRFEVGWLLTASIAVVLMIGLWRSRRPVSMPAKGMLIGVIGVMVAQFVSWRVAGELLYFSSFVPMIVIAIGLTLFPLTFAESTRTLKRVLAVLCLTSCLAALMGAEWATWLEYRLLPAPFTKSSLSGLFMHPNQLAPVAAMGLALVLGTWSKYRLLYGVLFSVTLWWTDSRTMIGAGAIVVLVASVRFVSLRHGRRWAAQVVAACGGLLALTFVGLRLFTDLRPWSRFMGLAGREALWSQAIDYWRSSMLIGVGPEAFDKQWQRVTGSARGAHNEILQTLAAQGLFGVAFLMCAIGAYIWAIGRARDEVRFTLVLVGIVGLSFLAMETPLRPEQSITGVGFLFVSVVATLCTSATSPDAARCSEADEKVTK